VVVDVGVLDETVASRCVWPGVVHAAALKSSPMRVAISLGGVIRCTSGKWVLAGDRDPVVLLREGKKTPHGWPVAQVGVLRGAGSTLGGLPDCKLHRPPHPARYLLSLKEFDTTDTLENAIAPAAIIGLSRPSAARGMAATL